MNDFKITLNKKQQLYLERMLPKGYSFQLFKVRKNIDNYPFKQFDKKFKKADSIIFSKKESIMESIEQSQQSYRERSQAAMKSQPLKPFQQDCLSILKKLKKHQSSYPFRAPVDPKALQIPDYFDIVLEPIDMKTIEQMIKRDEYVHMGQFQRDIYKMIMNSYKYNQKTSSTYTKTIQFEALYIQIMKQFYTNINVPVQEDVKQEMAEQYKYGQDSQNQYQSAQGKTSIVTPIVVNSQIKDKTKNPKLSKQIMKQIESIESIQRPRHSMKQLPKKPEIVEVQDSQIKHQMEVKDEQPEKEEVFKQIMIPQPALQPILTAKQQEQLQIKNQVQSYVENQTHNRELIFSDGYNQNAIHNSKIPHNEVQRQITHLLKRLSQFPLTKQKKTKIASKFNNLEQSMSQGDKRKLYQKIFKLDQNDLQYVIQILTRGRQQLPKYDDFQIDLEKCQTKVLREIQNFVVLRNQTNDFILTGDTSNVTINPVSAELIKPKRVRKQQKIKLKKKISKKQVADDDSFSINPNPTKRRRSQKPLRRRNYQQSNQENIGEIGSNQQKSQSQYQPQPLHGNSRGGGSSHNANNSNSGSNQAPFRYQGKTILQYHSNGHNNNNSHTNANSSFNNNQTQQDTETVTYHYRYLEQNAIEDPDKFLDLGQYIVPGRGHHDEYVNHYNEESVPLSGRSGRVRSNQNLHNFELFDDHNFHFGPSASKEYEDQIREYSMEQQKQQDQDQFFGS